LFLRFGCRTSRCTRRRPAVLHRGSGSCGGGCVPASGAGRSFRPPQCHGRFRGGSCRAPDCAGQRTPAAHRGRTAIPGPNEPSPGPGLSPPDRPQTGPAAPDRSSCGAWADQPATGRGKRPLTTGRYSQPSRVLMPVMPVTRTLSGASTPNCRSGALDAATAGFPPYRPGPACSRSERQCPQGQPAGRPGFRKSAPPVPPDPPVPADRQPVCDSQRPCHCRTRPAGPGPSGVHLTARRLNGSLIHA
jgi:hypothetical protein